MSTVCHLQDGWFCLNPRVRSKKVLLLPVIDNNTEKVLNVLAVSFHENKLISTF